MSLQLITGTSGSGKTTWLNQYMIEDSVKHPETQYILLVPEQYTMETQRMIVGMHPCHGTMNIDVLSFARLAHRIFTERGCEDYVVLDDMGKCVLLQKAALKHEKELSVFGRNLKKRGFISELKSMLSELYQYGITADQLESAQGQLRGQSILSGKLKDMITVYRAFVGELEEGTITGEELLPVMCRYLPESDFILNAVIGLDGFTGFTPLQYQVIGLLLQYGARVVVTITADPLRAYRKECAPHELFYLSHHTVVKLLELAGEVGVSVEPDICLHRNEEERRKALLSDRKKAGGDGRRDVIEKGANGNETRDVTGSDVARRHVTERDAAGRYVTERDTVGRYATDKEAEEIRRELPVRNRFSASPELAFVEEHILRYGRWRYEDKARPMVSPSETQETASVSQTKKPQPIVSVSKTQKEDRSGQCACSRSEGEAAVSGFDEKFPGGFQDADHLMLDNSDVHGVEIRVYASPAEEVRGICDGIYDLVMNRGYRYRELAVIAGDLETYGPLFRHQLEQYGIPCFLDQKNNLMEHPLVEYIRGLLEIVIRDFSYESVFRYLKCGLGSCSLEDRDYLENYAAACGIRGHKRWSETWIKERRSGAYTDFDRLNRIRQQVAEPLLGLYEIWKDKEITVHGLIVSLVQFLEQQEIASQLEQMQDKLKEQGMLLLAKEYSQAYGLVMKLLEEIDALLGTTHMPLKEFSACFDSGLEEIRVGLIPACTDRLIVGDMERTRLSGVRVLFFAGVNEGKVPGTSVGGGIFTDYDKEKLLNCQIELSPTGRMSSFMNRFYLYLALTRASDQLRISYAKNDGSGKAMRPSFCIAELAGMFPGLQIQDMESREGMPEGWNPVGTWNYLIRGMSDPEKSSQNPVWMQIYLYYYSRSPEAVQLLLAAAADGYTEEALTAALARKLYGQALQASVSRLEQQAACAFAHFLRYGLRLQERETFSFETTDMGTLFHDALERYFRAVKERKLDITQVDPIERKKLVQTCVADAARKAGSDILKETARNRWLAGKLERITDRTVWALGEQLKEGGYETDGCEVVFEPDRTEAFTIPLSDEVKMLLRGRIDRIDTREEGDQLYVRIVDYKSGSKTFDLVSVYYGLQIQLVFYMEAARENLKARNPRCQVKPGGVLYYNISDPIVERSPDMEEDAILDAVLDKLQMNGLVTWASLDEKGKEESAKKKKGKVEVVSEEQFSVLQSYVHETVRSLGQDIMKGRIAVDPYIKGQTSACTWCSYKSICGFDQKRRGYGYRNLAAISKAQIWEKMQEREESDRIAINLAEGSDRIAINLAEGSDGIAINLAEGSDGIAINLAEESDEIAMKLAEESDEITINLAEESEEEQKDGK